MERKKRGSKRKDYLRAYKQDWAHGGSSELAASIASCGPVTNKPVEAAATCLAVMVAAMLLCCL